MYRILFLLVFFGLITGTLFAQKSAFITYSIKDGLPQSQAIKITQDKEGYLWVATLGGLARFNGREFITVSVDDGLLTNRVKALSYIDSTFWVGHDGGISYMSNNRIHKVPFEGDLKSISVSGIVKFKNRIFVTSQSKYGGGLFELVDSTSLLRIKTGMKGELNRISTSFVLDDVLYLGTKEGVIRTTDAVHFKVDEDLPTGDYREILSDNKEIYYVSHKQGVFKQDLKTREIYHLDTKSMKRSINRDDISENSIRFSEAYLDSKSNLWLASLRGAMIVDKDDNVRLIDNEKGLPVNNISCFYEDTEENIWIGSLGKGIFRYPGEAFKYFDKSTVFGTDLFVTGFQKPNGDFLFGTNDEGILKMTSSGEVVNLYDDIVVIWSSLQQVDGKDWFGTQSNLISIDPNNNDKIEKFTYQDDDLPGRKITALYKLGPNSMYIGGSSGVSLYKNGVFTRLKSADKKSIGTVREFTILDGKMYCASNLGIYFYENEELKLFSDVGGVAYCLKKDRFNQLWFGTEEGLFRYRNGELKQVVLLSLDVPAANFINFLNYKDDQLYVGTNNGLFVLSNLDKENPDTERFGMGDGMVDLETNLNSGFFDLKGDFWFGSNSGLVRFTPEYKLENTTIPIVHLKSILLNYEPFDYSDYSEAINRKGLPINLALPYTKNNLTFELDGISLRHRNGLEYQFWLEGQDDKWSPLTKNPSLTFNGLGAGDYMLRIRCVDVNGNISDEVVFSFTIMEAYYRTWWFIGICALVVAGLVILFFRLRLKRINEANEKERLEYKTRLLSLEQQSMNASMNRHFVFNSLNSIQYFINTRDRISANKYLTNFAKLIRKNLDSATADGNVISLDEELERLHLYMSLESMRFKGRFDYEINVKNVDTESIMIPAMVLQPFVENSIIHGILPDEEKKGKITIDVINDNGDLIIRVEDNGIGVKQSLSKKVEIDGDHRSKGMEITSKRIELIQKISKNNISLEGPSELIGDGGSIKGTYVLLKIPQANLDI